MLSMATIPRLGAPLDLALRHGRRYFPRGVSMARTLVTDSQLATSGNCRSLLMSSHRHTCHNTSHQKRYIASLSYCRSLIGRTLSTTTTARCAHVESGNDSSNVEGGVRTTASMSGPLFRYIDAVESKLIEADRHQAQTAEQLQWLFEHLRDYEPPSLEELDELKRRKVERDERIQERIKSWEKQHVGKGWFAA